MGKRDYRLDLKLFSTNGSSARGMKMEELFSAENVDTAIITARDIVQLVGTIHNYFVDYGVEVELFFASGEVGRSVWKYKFVNGEVVINKRFC